MQYSTTFLKIYISISSAASKGFWQICSAYYDNYFTFRACHSYSQHNVHFPLALHSLRISCLVVKIT
jgi:hypothetical protein